MKRNLWIALVLTMMLFLWSGPASAEGDFNWTLENGILTISGSTMPDYTNGNSPWFSRKEEIVSVVIANGLNNIGNFAFANCVNLSSVSLPDSISNIGNYAFWECMALPSIDLPDQLISIGEHAFSSCIGLTEMIVPNSVTSMGRMCFYGCRNLASVTLPENLSYINQFAFGYCSALTNITIPSSVTRIDYGAFTACENLTSITLPSGLVSIGQEAFIYCSGLESIVIPNGITILDRHVFDSCTGLRSVRIPVTVTNIAYHAFSGCKAEFYFDGTIDQWHEISIGEDALYVFASIHCLDGNCNPGPLSGTCGINGDNLLWLLEPNGTLTISGSGAMEDYDWNDSPWYPYRDLILSVVIGDSVTRIGNRAFIWEENLADITMPDNIDVGSNVFEGCTQLGDANGLIIFHNMVYDYVGNAQTLTIPSGVTSIRNNAFSESAGLVSVSLPQSLTEIGDSAFSSCYNLTSVTIPGGVTSIGYGAFSSCPSLTAVNVVSSNKDFASVNGVLFNKQKDFLIYYPAGNTRTSYTVPSGVVYINSGWFVETEWGGFSGGGAFRECNYLTSITLPSSITMIGASTFSLCTNLRSVTIPASITKIDGYAFGDCESLNDVYYSGTPEQWRAIEVVSGNDPLMGATIHCANGQVIQPLRWTLEDGLLTVSGSAIPDYKRGDAPWQEMAEEIYSVIILDGMTHIGNNAFISCSNLTSVTIPNTVVSIGQYNFQLSGLESVTIPDSVTSIGEYAFNNMDFLTSVTIPAHVTHIGAGAFTFCWSLESISVDPANTSYSTLNGVLFNKTQTEIVAYPAGKAGTSYSIPEGVTSIGSNAFNGCALLSEISIPNSVTSIGTAAFRACFGLNSIMIPQGVTSIGNLAFAGSGISEITLPSGLTSINNWMFEQCENLAHIVIPQGVTSIGQNAFIHCQNLRTVEIPLSIQTIGDNAFYGCDGLEYVYYEGSESQRYEIEIGSNNDNLNMVQWNYHSYCLNHDVSWTLENGVLTVSGEALLNPVPWDVLEYRELVHSVILTEGIRMIGDSVFSGYYNLTSVSLPDSLVTISNSAFDSCYNLREITIPAGVTEIAHTAFSFCSGLTAFHVASGNAVYSDIDGVLFDLGGSRLYRYPAGNTRSSYIIPDGVTMLYQGWYVSGEGWYYVRDGAFSNANLLTSVIIPDGITSIGPCVFYGCENLASIVIPSSVTEIGGYAFCECGNLMNVYFTGMEEQWNQITFGPANDKLFEANIFYGDSKASGTCGANGDNVTWKLGYNGTLTISGSGAMADYSRTDSPWWALGDSVNRVVIEEGVQNIGRYAFVGLYQITSVTIPESVISIGDYAFFDMTELRDISLPEGLISIGESAFRATALENVRIPSTVTSIGAGAFSECPYLTVLELTGQNSAYSILDNVLYNKDQTVLVCCPAGKTGVINVPQGVAVIGDMSFQGCSGLVGINLPESLRSIGSAAFIECTGLSGISIPDSVTSIGDLAFRGCTGLTEMTLPAGLTTISMYLFKDCHFGSFEIPDGIQSIGMYAFLQCEYLTSITIPVSVTEIGEGAFLNCDWLTDVYYAGTDEQWNTIAIGNENDSLTNAIIHCVVIPDLRLPASLTAIESEAFAGIPDGTKVFIPASVTDIAVDAFGDVDVIICTISGSYAETFAREKGYRCVLMDQ